ncbi:MAG: TetR/AcrR family transcriptional regulator [Tetrasphaera sp.]|nr:TetR/AcrR family transcriptional regulator [Tetrasphaera sp.]
MPSATNGRAGDRRSEILDSAAELFARKGIAGTTVREIADEVGMLSGSLYHHFASKDEMVQAILVSFVETIISRYDDVTGREKDPAKVLDGLIHASIRTAVEMPHATEVYQTHARQMLESSVQVRTLATDIQKTWIDAIEAGVRAGQLRDDISPRVFYRLLRDAMWLTVRWYDPKRQDYSPEQLGDDCASIFLHGFARS